MAQAGLEPFKYIQQPITDLGDLKRSARSAGCHPARDGEKAD